LPPRIAPSAPDGDATASREGLAAVDFEIEERSALLQTAERQRDELSPEAGTAQQAHQRAAVALRREPVETQLAQIAETLQQPEQDWNVARRLALELEQGGDQWGRNRLNELLHELTNIHLVGRRNTPWEIEVPQVPALQG
jgi:hypothetical protein